MARGVCEIEDGMLTGVTYREDLASVKEAVAKMKAEGIYTEELWK